MSLVIPAELVGCAGSLRATENTASTVSTPDEYCEYDRWAWWVSTAWIVSTGEYTDVKYRLGVLKQHWT
jgi:hypothetical protein